MPRPLSKAHRQIDGVRWSKTASAPPIVVTDVGRTAATGAIPPGRSRAIAALGKLEPQRAGHGIGLSKPQRQPLTDTVGFAGLVAHQLLGAFIIAEIFASEVLRQDETVAAEVLDRR